MLEKKLLEQKIRDIRMIVFDFDGVFTDNRVFVFEDGSEAVCCSRSDGIGLQALKGRGIEILVLSSEPNPVVSARCRKIGIPCIQGCHDKVTTLQTLLNEQEMDWEELAYVGNDINDLGCLIRAGLPIVVQDAHPDVISQAAYRTRRPGGQGAVREVCDLVATLGAAAETSIA